jgi:hypothetical protein
MGNIIQSDTADKPAKIKIALANKAAVTPCEGVDISRYLM